MSEVKSNKYQTMPELSEEELKSLLEDIRENGILVPIIYDEDGNIIDGHHRDKVAKELELKDWPKKVIKGLTEEQKRAYSRKLNLARRHLSREQKRKIIEEQLKETPEKSSRSIGESIGADHKTVSSVRKKMEDGGEIPHLNKVKGADGKEQPVKKKKSKTIQPAPERSVERTNEQDDVQRERPSSQNHYHLASAVMGEIDHKPLDAWEQGKICQMSSDWSGRVWLNLFRVQDKDRGLNADDLLEEHKKGNCTEWMVLSDTNIRSPWFKKLAATADAICFHHDVSLLGTEEDGEAIVFYKGENDRKFYEEFSKHGITILVKPVEN